MGGCSLGLVVRLLFLNGFWSPIERRRNTHVGTSGLREDMTPTLRRHPRPPEYPQHDACFVETVCREPVTSNACHGWQVTANIVGIHVP